MLGLAYWLNTGARASARVKARFAGQAWVAEYNLRI
jgi:hypothetical protein